MEKKKLGLLELVVLGRGQLFRILLKPPPLQRKEKKKEEGVEERTGRIT